MILGIIWSAKNERRCASARWLLIKTLRWVGVSQLKGFCQEIGTAHAKVGSQI